MCEHNLFSISQDIITKDSFRCRGRLDQSILEDVGELTSPVQTKLKVFPYPPYNDDKFITVLQTQLPFIILLSFILIAPTMCKDIVLEKEKKIKVFHLFFTQLIWIIPLISHS